MLTLNLSDNLSVQSHWPRITGIIQEILSTYLFRYTFLHCLMLCLQVFRFRGAQEFKFLLHERCYNNSRALRITALVVLHAAA